MLRHEGGRGSLEPTRNGKAFIRRSALGYVTKHGGFSPKRRNARLFRGAGEAIYAARINGFAILEW